MQCPVCRVDLMIADRQGVEIDYCPRCRGIWLDRGELDKIIERMAMEHPRGSGGEYGRQQPHYAPSAHSEEHHKHHGHYKHKRKSFLQEIFDFD